MNISLNIVSSEESELDILLFDEFEFWDMFEMLGEKMFEIFEEENFNRGLRYDMSNDDSIVCFYIW